MQFVDELHNAVHKGKVCKPNWEKYDAGKPLG